MSSAGIRSLDRDSVIAGLREIAARIAAAHREVREVRLFGSLARGSRNPYADADLLVLLDHSDTPFRDRMPLYKPMGSPVPLDMLVVTASELEREIAAGNRFVVRALRESIALYERADGRA